MALACGSQSQHRLILQALSSGFGFVQHHRNQILQWSVLERKLASAPSRQKNQSTRLLFHQPANQIHIPIRQLAFTHANITQKNNVILRDRVAAIREGSEVIPPATRLHSWM